MTPSFARSASRAVAPTASGLAVAYARVALIDDVLTITELGRFEDGAAALAKLVASFLEPRDDDPG